MEINWPGAFVKIERQVMGECRTKSGLSTNVKLLVRWVMESFVCEAKVGWARVIYLRTGHAWSCFF